MYLKPSMVVAASAASLLLVSAQDLSSLSPCGVNCYNSVIASGLGCDSGDTTCLCANPDFGYGLRDCAEQACGPDEVAQVASFSTSLCVATGAEPIPSDTSPVIATSPPAESAASPPPTPSPSTSRSPPAEEGEEEALSSTASVQSPPPNLTSITSSEVAPFEGSSTTTLSTITNSQTSSVEESASDETANSEPLTDDDDNSKGSDSSAAALATPAIIGISVGAGVAAIGSGIALFLLCRRRQKASRARSLQISEPMPGSGRDYSGGLGSVSDKNLTELETKSKRYEDMIPRQSPRSMI